MTATWQPTCSGNSPDSSPTSSVTLMRQAPGCTQASSALARETPSADMHMGRWPRWARNSVHAGSVQLRVIDGSPRIRARTRRTCSGSAARYSWRVPGRGITWLFRGRASRARSCRRRQRQVKIARSRRGPMAATAWLPRPPPRRGCQRLADDRCGESAFVLKQQLDAASLEKMEAKLLFKAPSS